jgi:hypothetical protein
MIVYCYFSLVSLLLLLLSIILSLLLSFVALSLLLSFVVLSFLSLFSSELSSFSELLPSHAL